MIVLTVLSVVTTCLLEFVFHGRIVPCELFDGQFFGFVVCEPQVVFRAEKSFFYFLQMVY